MKYHYDEDRMRYMEQLFPKAKGPSCELCGRKGSLLDYYNAQVGLALPPYDHPLLNLAGRKGVPHKVCWECADTWNRCYPDRSIDSKAARRLRELNQVLDNVRAIEKLFDADTWVAVKKRLYNE